MLVALSSLIAVREHVACPMMLDWKLDYLIAQNLPKGFTTWKRLRVMPLVDVHDPEILNTLKGFTYVNEELTKV